MEYTITRAPGQIGRRELVVGYLRAFYRFQAEHDRDRSQIEEEAQARWTAGMALFETLTWADTLIDFLERTSEDKGGSPGWLASLTPQQLAIVKGFKCVRGRIHHRWWEAVAVQVAPEGETPTWLWGKLPKGGRSDGKEEHYRSALEGQAVMETLEVLRDIFWSMRRWQIARADLEQPAYPLPPAAPTDA